MLEIQYFLTVHFLIFPLYLSNPPFFSLASSVLGIFLLMACVVVVCIAVCAIPSVGFVLGRRYIFKKQARNQQLSRIQVHVCNIMGKD